MKLKMYGASAVVAITILSCGPKLAVTTQTPDPVQVPPKIASLNETPESQEMVAGRMLYENNCAKCHKLFAPSDYSGDAWGPILVRMQVKARLGDADMAKISNYIYEHLQASNKN